MAPSTYVAQASALGFAQQFHPGVPTSATATTLTVASDLTNINFGMTHSSDITGAINYGGTQTGTLRVRLFSDAALTHQVYDSAIPSPSFIEGRNSHCFNKREPMPVTDSSRTPSSVR